MQLSKYFDNFIVEILSWIKDKSYQGAIEYRSLSGCVSVCVCVGEDENVCNIISEIPQE